MSIPYVGYARNLFTSLTGLVLFILLPGGLLIASEVFSLVRESSPRHKALMRRRRRA